LNFILVAEFNNLEAENFIGIKGGKNPKSIIFHADVNVSVFSSQILKVLFTVSNFNSLLTLGNFLPFYKFNFFRFRLFNPSAENFIISLKRNFAL